MQSFPFNPGQTENMTAIAEDAAEHPGGYDIATPFTWTSTAPLIVGVATSNPSGTTAVVNVAFTAPAGTYQVDVAWKLPDGTPQTSSFLVVVAPQPATHLSFFLG